jgi:uncharacterized protein
MIDLKTEHLLMVQRILADQNPFAQVWAFGSRVTGTAKKFSDLDLAIDAGRDLSFLEMANLREEFQESDLPMSVDLVDLHMVQPAFHKLVKAQRVLVQEAAHAAMPSTRNKSVR